MNSSSLNRIRTCAALITAAILCLAAGAVEAQSEEVEAKIVSMPTLDIPSSVTDAGIRGRVKIAISVDKAGNVERAEVTAGPMWPCGSNPKSELKLARKLIEDTILAARFEPRRVKGEAVGAELELTTNINGKDEALNVGRLPSQARMINAGVVNGKAKRLPKPNYPSGARAERASGAVAVEVVVDVDGKVEAAGAISGHRLLRDAARDSACDALFEPARLQGSPIRFTGVITYAFIP